MSRVTVPFPKLAEIALSAMSQATVKADDDTLAMIVGCRRFLRAIMDGTLIVMQAAPPEAPPAQPGEEPQDTDALPPGLRGAAPAPPASNVRGSEGVVPETVTGAPRRRRR